MADTTELNALEKAVNDVSGRASGLWLGFISLAAYLALTVGSVTHRALFLETPLKMPILNVDLPLSGFFFVAPLMFVIFHFYLLLQLHGLTQKLSEYDKLLAEGAMSATLERLNRHHLDNFIFIQIRSGPRYPNDRATKWLLTGIAWTTVVVLPFAVLLSTEFTFLPYHGEFLTWFHRLLICIDIVAVLYFWPVITGRERSLNDLLLKVGPTSAVACLMLFSLFLALFPGESIYKYVRSPLTRFLFEGSIDPVTGHAQSLFANRLMIPDQTLINTKDLGQVQRTVSLRGRDLRGAVLSRSDLRDADFTGAILTGAVLIEANLQGAWFGCADKLHSKNCADLRSADLGGARLESAQLEDAFLQGASFLTANLSGALLNGAVLLGADLRSSKLNGAKTFSATLKGATLDGAHLDQSTFDPEDLEGVAAIDVSGLVMTGLPDSVWTKENDGLPLNDPKRKALAERLAELACDPSNAPHAAHGIIRNRFLTHAGEFLVPVAKKLALAKNADCKGGVSLTEEDLAVLEDQRQAAQPKN
jgi:uncharacterized protein YjbI with pentapeptide repeats